MYVAQPILLVVHQATSNPGLVAQLLERLGYPLELCCPAAGGMLPRSLDPYAGVVVFGGPMSANDDAKLPFIQAELGWIEQVLASGTPYLGICLGAQLLARVLGAAVAPHSQAQVEVGYHAITPTAAGAAELGGLRQVYQWHREGFELPAGATLLATGDLFVNQAFRYGSQVYGLQFHPEITQEIMERWLTVAAQYLQLPGVQPRDRQLHNHTLYGTAVEQWLQGFLCSWLQQPALSQQRYA